MYVERAIYPITTLGPGNRLAIWFKGCSKHCFGCANPELWDVVPSRDKNLPVDEYSRYVRALSEQFNIRRLTLTGGDPLEQADDLTLFLKLIRNAFDDILIYTGFTVEEAVEVLGSELFDEIKSRTDVLIDGRYVDELNDDVVPLRGSKNQRVFFFNSSLTSEYEAYMSKGRVVTNIVQDGRAISVGIHNRGEYRKRHEEVCYEQ